MSRPPKKAIVKTLSQVTDKDIQKLDKELSKRNKGYLTYRYVTTNKPIHRQILVLSCIHFPFQDQAMLDKAIADNRKADVVVLNGDIMDQYSASGFTQYKSIELVHEYIMAYEFIEYLASIFPAVVLVKGNHDSRLDLYFGRRVDTSLQTFIETDLLAKITRGEKYFTDGERQEKLEPIKNVIYNPGTEPYHTRIGKTIFIHPSKYVSAPMGTVIAAADHMEKRGEDFDCMCLGHTHYQGTIPRNRKLLIETGCLGILMDYQKQSRGFYTPQHSGYAIISQDKDGRTIFEKSGHVYLGITVEHKDDLAKRLPKIPAKKKSKPRNTKSRDKT